MPQSNQNNNADDITWKSLHEEFVPRAEHQATNLPNRVSALEQTYIELLKRVIESESRLRELVITTVNIAIKESLVTQLNESQKENTGLKGRYLVWIEVGGGLIGILNGGIQLLHVLTGK